MCKCLSRAWRGILDAFYHARQWAATLITFLSIHLFGSEVSWEEVKKGKLGSTTHTDRNLDAAEDLDLILSEARSCLAGAEARRTAITDKCKSLLTLSSLVLAASGVLLSKASLNDSWLRVVLFLTVLALLHVVILLAMLFAVRSDMQMSIDQDDVHLPGKDLKKSLINAYLSCQADRDNRVDFLVEVYKTARFFFLAGLTMLVIVLSFSFLQAPDDELPERVATELISDERFLDSVRDRTKNPGTTCSQGRKREGGSSPRDTRCFQGRRCRADCGAKPRGRAKEPGA
jgi:hypothetical protein